MRYPLLSAPLLVVLAVADPVRAGANEPTIQAGASNAFVVRPTPDTSKENVIPQIVDAGRDQLATACAADPAASVRILNPLASGEYADVACSTLLDGGEPVCQAREELTSGGERVGQAQQKWSPFGVACSILTIGSGLVANRLLCPRATTPQDQANCGYVTDGGFSTLGFLCFLL